MVRTDPQPKAKPKKEWKEIEKGVAA